MIYFASFKIENNDKQQTTTTQGSPKTVNSCVLLKSFRWFVTEPISYLWNYMKAMKNALVNLTTSSIPKTRNTVGTSAS